MPPYSGEDHSRLERVFRHAFTINPQSCSPGYIPNLFHAGAWRPLQKYDGPWLTDMAIVASEAVTSGSLRVYFSGPGFPALLVSFSAKPELGSLSKTTRICAEAWPMVVLHVSEKLQFNLLPCAG